MTWTDAIKKFLAALAAIGRFLDWLSGRRKAEQAAETKKDSAHEAARNLDPDVLGDRLRRGLRRDGK
jgi:hypothetical protein